MKTIESNEPITIDIWPGFAPGETTSETGRVDKWEDLNFLTDVTRPQLTIYRADMSTHSSPTVLILPGGGYEILADQHEGIDIALWFNSIGFSAAILRYRVPKKPDSAYADAQRAMRVLRNRHAEFGIALDRLGVLGFSAGAHLAARISARYAHNGYILLGMTDEQHVRPDFTLLIYPSYLTNTDGSIAENVKPRATQPPVFIMQTVDDEYFSARPYAKAAKEAGVDTTYFEYEKGGHGYGLKPDSTLPVNNWPREAEKWVQRFIK